MQNNNNELVKVCHEIPKAELHLHIEGTIEPEMVFELAKRNNIKIPYNSPEEIKEKFQFKNLQDFLDIYYQSCNVLVKEEDFEDLIYAYLKKAASQGLKYAEIFFDPQTHIPRNIKFETFMNGFKRGLSRARNGFNIDAQFIMCFQRHLSQEDAIDTLKLAKDFKNDILGVGLDSSEKGFPPELFRDVYQMAREEGYRCVAHAGEEGPHTYVTSAIDVLKVERIDHGIATLENEELIKRVAELKIPLTICPLSNKKLQVIPDLKNFPLKKFIDNNVLVMLNSDDPSYFGGYIGDNYEALQRELNLSLNDIISLAKSSFIATFLGEEKKQEYINMIDEYIKTLK